MKERKSQDKFGVIVLLDALGVKNMDMNESNKFITDIYTIQNLSLQRVEHFTKSTNKYSKDYKINIFGDTVIFSWNIFDRKFPFSEIENKLSQHLAGITLFTSTFLINAMNIGIFFRGVISVGKFIEMGNIILGPAATDAANWYNSAEWIGVFATPFCTNFLNMMERHCKAPNFVPIECYYKKYSVPLKDNSTIDLWAVNWPFQYQYEKKFNPNFTIKSALDFLYRVSLHKHWPKGTELKYFNTENFVKYCLNSKKRQGSKIQK
jgi:hypothetical protein